MATLELIFKYSEYHFVDQDGRSIVLNRTRLNDSYKYSLFIGAQLTCEKMHEELKCLTGILPQSLKGASWVQNVIQEMMMDNHS